MVEFCGGEGRSGGGGGGGGWGDAGVANDLSDLSGIRRTHQPKVPPWYYFLASIFSRLTVKVLLRRL